MKTNDPERTLLHGHVCRMRGRSGADTAILQKQCSPEELPRSESERDLFLTNPIKEQ